MISTPIRKFYKFGRTFRYLLDSSQGRRLKGDSFTLGNIQKFFDQASELGLTITARSKPYYDLVELNEQFIEDESEKLSLAKSVKLKKIMKEIDIVLDAEISGLNAYIVSPKRIDVQTLLNNVSSLFSPKVFNKLPQIAKTDLEEAGKCIAFELPTAAAFHLLRATESVLREFYLKFINRDRIKNLMWGNIITDLRKRRKSKPYEDLFNHLDHIRKAFRNPTQHPEMIYDIHEVQDLWSICVDSINRMSKIF